MRSNCVFNQNRTKLVRWYSCCIISLKTDNRTNAIETVVKVMLCYYGNIPLSLVHKIKGIIDVIQ